MILRSAGQADAEQLAAIHEACFPNYWKSEAFTDFFAVEGTKALMAVPGPCGMIVYRVQHEQADIITLAVRPEYRRQGAAKAMVAQALEEMRQSGAEEIFLDVEDGNAAAIRLYESFGFVYHRRRKLYYRQKDGSYTDALVMRKTITPKQKAEAFFAERKGRGNKKAAVRFLKRKGGQKPRAEDAL